MAELAPGTEDSQILVIAARDDRIVLTFDRDFGELVFHRGMAASGVILLRLYGQTPDAMIEQFRDVWNRVSGWRRGIS